jgi:hypothetical protein
MVSIKERISENRKRLAEQWKERGFDPKKFRSSSIAPPPLEGLVRAYHFTCKKYGRAAIGDRRLKVARFSDANDPFELMAISSHTRKARQVLGSFRKDLDSNTGLLCFTKDWTKLLLWSHYADKHKGICLGFDLKQNTFEEVEYVDKRLRPELDDEEQFTLPERLQTRLHLLKASDWRYEEELRILVNLSQPVFEDPLYFSRFTEDMRLVEVILGQQSGLSVPEIESLTDALKPDVYVSLARLERTGFRVIPNGDHLSSKLALEP